jgi:hypothetical protein
MTKLLGVLLAMAVVLGAVPIARSIEPPSTPPGILDRNWIPMGNAAGFVITNGDRDAQGQSASVTGVAKGYLMVRRSGRWLKVNSGLEDRVHPAMDGR